MWEKLGLKKESINHEHLSQCKPTEKQSTLLDSVARRNKDQLQDKSKLYELYAYKIWDYLRPKAWPPEIQYVHVGMLCTILLDILNVINYTCIA